MLVIRGGCRKRSCAYFCARSKKLAYEWSKKITFKLAHMEAIMDIFPGPVTLAALAAAFALISGICSTVTDGEVRGLNSNQWMFRRVGFQAVAIVILLFALLIAH